ncbi:hypothetical protein MRX96_054169 [Rhipicephalus microplus]
MHRAPPPVTGASNPSRTSPGPIEHKNRRQPPVQQTPNHNNDASTIDNFPFSQCEVKICLRGASRAQHARRGSWAKHGGKTPLNPREFFPPQPQCERPAAAVVGVSCRRRRGSASCRRRRSASCRRRRGVPPAAVVVGVPPAAAVVGVPPAAAVVGCLLPPPSWECLLPPPSWECLLPPPSWECLLPPPPWECLLPPPPWECLLPPPWECLLPPPPWECVLPLPPWE